MSTSGGKRLAETIKCILYAEILISAEGMFRPLTRDLKSARGENYYPSGSMRIRASTHLDVPFILLRYRPNRCESHSPETRSLLDNNYFL